MQPVDSPRIYSGRYELTHLVARGGMALVYRAVDRELDRAVALKVLFPELSVDRAFVERFRREAQAAANLSHPNIVPVFDWGEDDGAYFIVMEFIEGKPLSAVLREEPPMEPERIARIGAGVAAALAFAHRHGVVHRDVKPGNILITPEGDVKVTDFGIARAVNTEESLTQTGAVMGTAAYFSPEQAEGKGVDARSDIYSLGVVLYEMAVGRPPFTGDSPVAVASKHVRDHPVLPRVANPAVPVAFEAVVMKAMSKNPADRYASAEELRADLLRFADGRPVEAVDPVATGVMGAVGAFDATEAVMATGQTQAIPLDGGPYPDAEVEERERRRRIRRLVVLLVVLLVALGVVAFFLVRSVGSSTVDVPERGGSAPGRRGPHACRTTGSTSARSPRSRTRGRRERSCRPTRPRGPRWPRARRSTWWSAPGPNVPIVTVPPVKGEPLQQAIQALNAAGLSFTVHNVPGGNEPAGTVLDQSPTGWEQGQADDEGGPHRVRQPDLGVGAERRRADTDGGRCHLEPGAPQRGRPDGRLLRSVRRRAGLGPEPPGGPDRATEHRRLGRDLHRAVRHRARRGRAGLRLGPTGHRRGGPRRQHHLRHGVPGRRQLGHRGRAEPCGQFPGAIGEHRDHLGVSGQPADHHDDHRPRRPRPRRPRRPCRPPRLPT